MRAFGHGHLFQLPQRRRRARWIKVRARAPLSAIPQPSRSLVLPRTVGMRIACFEIVTVDFRSSTSVGVESQRSAACARLACYYSPRRASPARRAALPKADLASMRSSSGGFACRLSDGARPSCRRGLSAEVSIAAAICEARDVNLLKSRAEHFGRRAVAVRALSPAAAATCSRSFSAVSSVREIRNAATAFWSALSGNSFDKSLCQMTECHDYISFFVRSILDAGARRPRHALRHIVS